MTAVLLMVMLPAHAGSAQQTLLYVFVFCYVRCASMVNYGLKPLLSGYSCPAVGRVWFDDNDVLLVKQLSLSPLMRPSLLPFNICIRDR